MKRLTIILSVVILTGCAGIQTVGKRNAMIDANPQWPEKYVKEIKQGRINIGMTPKMVKAAYGNPININKTTTEYGSRFQLVYPMEVYVYIEQNKVVAIQR